jgi:hypothetical protein
LTECIKILFLNYISPSLFTNNKDDSNRQISLYHPIRINNRLKTSTVA